MDISITLVDKLVLALGGPGIIRLSGTGEIRRRMARSLKKTKFFHYMTYVPNIAYFSDPQLYSALTEAMLTPNREQTLSVKVICYDEESWCRDLRGIVRRFTRKGDRDGETWHRYLRDTLRFVEGLHDAHGPDVVRVLPSPLPFHVGITSDQAIFALPDVRAFENLSEDTVSRSIQFLAFRIKAKHKDQMAIIDHWFNEYYDNVSRPLDIEKLREGLVKLGLQA